MHKIGIIGVGLIAQSHADALLTLNDAKLVAIADINEEKAVSFSKKYKCQYYLDAEEMLKHPDLDIVIICLPTFLHEKYVSLCAQYGKHILCEKPIEMTSHAAEKMLESVKNNGVIFMVGQVVRFWPGYREIKQIYESGQLGEVYMAFASRCSERPFWGDWLLDPQKGAGAIQDMHVHDVDFLRYLFGEMDYVFCHANKDDTGCWNHAMSSITFKSGEKAVAEASFTMASGYPFTMLFKAAGTKGTIDFFYKAGSNIGIRDSATSELHLYQHGKEPTFWSFNEDDAYREELKYFLSCVENGMQPKKIPHHENLEVIKAVEAIRKSADTNEVIYLK